MFFIPQTLEDNDPPKRFAIFSKLLGIMIHSKDVFYSVGKFNPIQIQANKVCGNLIFAIAQLIFSY